jgi:hypothetical protein
MNDDSLLKKTDFQKIAREGSKIYAQIKNQYVPKETGKFLAIEIETKKVYLGQSSAEALNKARQHHPQKVFFVVKIGFEAAETVAYPSEYQFSHQIFL